MSDTGGLFSSLPYACIYPKEAHNALRREGVGPVLLLAGMTEEWRSREGLGRVRAVGSCCNGAAVEPWTVHLFKIIHLAVSFI